MSLLTERETNKLLWRSDTNSTTNSSSLMASQNGPSLPILNFDVEKVHKNTFATRMMTATNSSTSTFSTTQDKTILKMFPDNSSFQNQYDGIPCEINENASSHPIEYFPSVDSSNIEDTERLQLSQNSSIFEVPHDDEKSATVIIPDSNSECSETLSVGNPETGGVSNGEAEEETQLFSPSASVENENINEHCSDDLGCISVSDDNDSDIFEEGDGNGNGEEPYMPSSIDSNYHSCELVAGTDYQPEAYTELDTTENDAKNNKITPVSAGLNCNSVSYHNHMEIFESVDTNVDEEGVAALNNADWTFHCSVANVEPEKYSKDNTEKYIYGLDCISVSDDSDTEMFHDINAIVSAEEVDSLASGTILDANLKPAKPAEEDSMKRNEPVLDGNDCISVSDDSDTEKLDENDVASMRNIDADSQRYVTKSVAHLEPEDLNTEFDTSETGFKNSNHDLNCISVSTDDEDDIDTTVNNYDQEEGGVDHGCISVSDESEGDSLHAFTSSDCENDQIDSEVSDTQIVRPSIVQNNNIGIKYKNCKELYSNKVFHATDTYKSPQNIHFTNNNDQIMTETHNEDFILNYSEQSFSKSFQEDHTDSEVPEVSVSITPKKRSQSNEEDAKRQGKFQTLRPFSGHMSPYHDTDLESILLSMQSTSKYQEPVINEFNQHSTLPVNNDAEFRTVSTNEASINLFNFSENFERKERSNPFNSSPAQYQNENSNFISSNTKSKYQALDYDGLPTKSLRRVPSIYTQSHAEDDDPYKDVVWSDIDDILFAEVESTQDMLPLEEINPKLKCNDNEALMRPRSSKRKSAFFSADTLHQLNEASEAVRRQLAEDNRNLIDHSLQSLQQNIHSQADLFQNASSSEDETLFIEF